MTMPRCSRCCLSTCVIHTDDYNRANSTNLGADWDETVGDSKILDNQLVTPADANAMVLSTLRNTVSGRAVDSVHILPVNGDKPQIVVNSDVTGTNFQYVEAHCTTASLVLKAGGQTRTYTAVDHGWDITARPITMHCCLDDGCLLVRITHAGFDGGVWDNTVTVNNARRYSGLRSGGSTVLTWDNWSCAQHQRDTGTIECDNCICYCIDTNGDRYYPPWNPKLTYFSDGCPNASICCCGWDGFCVDLEWDFEVEYWRCVDNGSLYGGTYDEDSVIVKCGAKTDPTTRCLWLLDQFACCSSNAAPAGCDAPPDSCDEQSADTFTSATCGAGVFAVRWDFNWVSSDLNCDGCEPLVDAPCGFYAIMTEGDCA